MEMSEEVSDFLNDPSLGKFEKLTKRHLVELGEEFQLYLEQSMMKAEMRGYVVFGLVDEDVIHGEGDIAKKYAPVVRKPEDIERAKERIERIERGYKCNYGNSQE